MSTTMRVEELEKKIQRLEAAHAKMRKDLSLITTSAAAPPPPPPRPPVVGCDFTETDYLNILLSMGRAVHIMDLYSRIFYWNHSAETLFGYSAADAIGTDICDLLISSQDVPLAKVILQRLSMGQCWAGLFPVKHKTGRELTIVVSNTPFYDDDGTLIGTLCVASDTRLFMDVQVSIPDPGEEETGQDFSRPQSRHDPNPDQPLRTAIASKLTNLASKVSNNVRSKMKIEFNVLHESENGDSGLFDAVLSPKGKLAGTRVGFFSSFSTGKSPAHSHGDSSGEGEGKLVIHKMIASRAETWIGKKAIQLPWKDTEHESCEPQSVRPGWLCIQSEQDSNQAHSAVTSQIQATDYNKPIASEVMAGPWSSYNVHSSSSASICGSGSSSATHKLDAETDCSDYEIMWEDMTVGEQIGQGSCGTVYHGLWCGSDVAIKVFSKQEYSEEVIFSFRQEVSLMKQLRHPNILLFMGAVTLHQRLCIVTEFLPRGSLFLLLQRSTYKLDWRRQLQMALDIARGMNHLHNCNPPIVHRDLKSSNLLVDRNWSVKVADFGLSRVKHETYLATKTGKGTPQWMAPEVLQNGRSDEKSDLYSFGVILWELATQKIPWENLNAMQVIGTVGFMDQRLDVPEDVDPTWASMIESCWRSEPQSRPTFGELLEKLKDMQKQYNLRSHAARVASAALTPKQV